MTDAQKCELCGEPMPVGEEMFKFHGYSGNCPKPPLPKPSKTQDKADIVLAVNAMAEESLDPETFDKWLDVVKVLKATRSDLGAMP